MTREVDAGRVSRPAIAKMLAHSLALAASMAAIRFVDGSGTTFRPDMDRVRRIITKVARAHASYELDEHFEYEPTSAEIISLQFVSNAALHDFERLGSGGFTMWPEVGSRARHRLIESYPRDRPGWVVVQEGKYRYTAAVEGGRLRMVLSEYLYCKFVWDW